MVKVEAPDGWVNPNADSSEQPSASAAASSGASFDEIDDLLADRAVPGKKLTKRPAATKPVKQSPSSAGKPVATNQTSTKQTARSAANAAAQNNGAQATPMLPDSSWMGQQARQKQKWLLLVFGLLAILITASILAFTLVSSLLGPETIAENQTEEEVSSQVDENEQTSETPLDNPLEDSDDPSTVDPQSNEANDNNQPEETQQTQGEVDPASNGSDNATETDNVIETDNATETPKDASTTPDNGVSEIVDTGNNQSTSSIDDLNSIPDGIFDANENDSPKPSSLLEEFAIIRSFADSPGENAAIDQIFGDLKEETIGRSRLYIPKPESFEIDLDKQTNLLIHGLRTKKTLRGLADKIYQLSRVPVTIDVESIELTGELIRQMVEVEAIEKSVSELANENLKPFGLQFVPIGQGAFAVIEGYGDSVQTNYTIPAADTFSDEEFAGLVQSIEKSIHPDVWDVNGGQAAVDVVDKELVCRAPPRTQVLVNRLMQKLSYAEQLNRDKSNETALQGSQVLYRQRRKFDEIKLEGSFVLDIRLEKITELIEQEHNISIFVDWNRLAQEGWNPDTLVPWNPDGRSLSEMLNDICHAMRTQWRILSEDLIVITSRDSFLNHMDIEIYPMSAFENIKLSEEQLLNVLQSQLGSATAKIPTSIVSFQDKYDCLIAILPQNLQFQLARIMNRLNE